MIKSKTNNMKKIINKRGILTIISILLILFKITGIINWSWWIVTAPVWIGAAILIFILIIWALLPDSNHLKNRDA